MGNRLQVPSEPGDAAVLQILINEWPPFIFFDWSKRLQKPYGPMIKLLETFKFPKNVSYELRRPTAASQYGVDLGNGTWTGKLGFIQREEADIFLGPTGITYEAAQVGEFTTYLTIDHITILSVKSQATIGLLDPFTTLNWKVWALFSGTFAALLSFSMLFEFLMRRKNAVNFKKDKQAPYRRIHYSSIVISFVSSLFSQDFQAKLISTASRMIVVVAYVMAIFVNVLFGNLLTTSLVVQPQGNVINSLEDLIQQKKICPYVYEDSPQMHLFQKSEQYLPMAERLNQCKESIIKFDKIRLPEPMNRIVKKSYVFIDSSPEIRRFGNFICKENPETWLNIAKPFNAEILAILLRRNLDPEMKRKFNTHIASLVESGIFTQWVKQAEEPPSVCFQRTVSSEVDALRLETMKKLFFVYFFVIGFSIAVLLLELILHGFLMRQVKQEKVVRIPMRVNTYYNPMRRRLLDPFVYGYNPY